MKMANKRGSKNIVACVSVLLLFIIYTLFSTAYADNLVNSQQNQTKNPQQVFNEAFLGFKNDVDALSSSINQAINTWKGDIDPNNTAKQLNELKSKIESTLNQLKQGGAVSQQLNLTKEWIKERVNGINNDVRLSASQRKEFLDEWEIIDNQIDSSRKKLNDMAIDMSDMLNNVLQQQGYMEHLIELQHGHDISKHIKDFIDTLQHSMTSIRNRLLDMKLPQQPSS